jgi:hypothetical protein
MPCRRKNDKGCDFELMVLPPHLETGEIQVYANSEHNHPLMPEGIFYSFFKLIQ